MPTGLMYVLRQYSGFTLGALSIFLTWYTHDGEDAYVMTKLWACCLLGVVALVLHELRPYKVRTRARGLLCRRSLQPYTPSGGGYLSRGVAVFCCMAGHQSSRVRRQA